ncbi:Ig-like domain-containing protein [Halosegnis marinus]|uniref:Ig-like domain-containing protein n=1 Tax=Halosegnis marinus TaxID=3034023 RepID=UPI0036187A72
MYNRFDNGVRQVDDGSFVSGRSIDLVALDGSRSASQVSPLTLDLVPLSAETETVRVTGDASDPLVVTLSTDLTPDQWASFLSGELDENGGYVTDVRAAPGGVAVEFAPGTYELTLADVAVGGGAERSGPTYLTTPDATPTVESGGDLTVEARDAFNDPEPGVEVAFSTSDGSLSSTTATTDGTGAASVTFTPRAGVSTATVTAEADLDGSGTVEADERVTFDVTVTGASDGGVGGLNPAGQGSVRQTAATNDRCTAPNTGTGTVALTDNDCRVLVDFENLGDDTRTIQQARVSFYSPESYDVGTGNNARRRPTPETVTLGGETLEVGGDFEAVSLAAIGGVRPRPTSSPSPSRRDATTWWRATSSSSRSSTRTATSRRTSSGRSSERLSDAPGSLLRGFMLR